LEPIRGELGQREALRRLLGDLRPWRGALALGVLFTLLFSLVNLGYGWLAKLFLDEVQANAGTGRMGNLTPLALLAAGVMIVRGGLYFAYNYTWAYGGQRLAQRLRDAVFAHLQHLPVSFFDRRKTGQLMSVLSHDVPAVTTLLTAIQDSLSAPLVIVGGVVLLFLLNWPLALLSLVCLPPIALVISRATRRMGAASRRVQEDLATVTEHADETLAGIRTIKAFGNEAHEIGRFEGRSRDVFRSVLRALRIRLTLFPTVELLGTLAILGVLWIGGAQIVMGQGAFTFGDLTWFVLVLKEVGNAARNAGNIAVNLGAAGAAADRIYTLLAIRSDLPEKPDARPLANVRGRVALEGVSFAYAGGEPVLEDVSFTLEPGQVVALVGPTGSGKTTVAGLIPRFYDVTAGRVTLDGVDVRDCHLPSLRAQIGIVPQDPALFAGTLRENIAYGRLDASPAEIEAAARTANAWEFIERLPAGLDTVVGERGTRLSGGQRQRIAIARAVLRNPRVLLLDEATSALDAQSEALVQEALQRLVADRTTLVIAHRLSTVRDADAIVVLRDGRVEEVGRHADLLRAGGHYAELHAAQVGAGGA